MQGKEPEKAAGPQQDVRQPSQKAGAGKRQLTEARTPQLRTSKRRRTTAAAPAMQPVAFLPSLDSKSADFYHG